MKIPKYWYKGIRCFHEENAIPIIREIVKEFTPELIIEFGTSFGGMTLIFHEIYPDIELHTFGRPDLPELPNRRKVTERYLFGESVIFHQVDILKYPVEEIVTLCKDERRKFLYCDNGNKPKEVEMYSKYLNVGDMIGCHDWGTEIFAKDVEGILDRYEPIRHAIFESNDWRSRFWRKI